jgi:hypothetical protein
MILTTGSDSTPSDLTACQLFNGSTPLNTGSNVVNSTNIAVSGSKTVFTFDNAFTIPHGTVVTLALKCNVSSAAGGGTPTSNTTYQWKADTANGDYTITGITSGVSIVPTLASGNAPTMTASVGSFTETAANSSVAQPSLLPVAAGTTGVTMGYVKFHASNEAVNLTKIGLTLSGTNGKYGSLSTGLGGSSNGGSGDVVTAYIYNGSMQVGTATFSGSQTTATSTLSTFVTLPKDQDIVLTIKADVAAIGVSASGGIGDVLTIDPVNAEASGVSSGKTVGAGLATSGVSGVQLFKSFPTVAFVSNSINPNGPNVVLKKFTVTANAAGPVGIYQMAFSVATSSASVYDLKLYAYTDAGYSQGVSSQGSGTGQIGNATCTVQGTCNTASTVTAVFQAATNPVEIPAGSTYYFALLGTVTPTASANNWTISPTLIGDSIDTLIGPTPTTYNATTTANIMATRADNGGTAPAAYKNFIWSDNATTTSAFTDVDWMNGYQVPGLPSTGI